MDHLPMPQDRFIGSLAIPFLATDDYTSPFLDYPQRNGWNIEFGKGKLEPVLNHSPTSHANKDLVSLMQTWLYFGLLSEFLGAPVQMESFQRASESGSMVLSTKILESLVCNRTSWLLEHSEVNGPALVESWRDAFYGVFLVVRYRTSFLFAQPATDDQALSLTCLAISVLAEYTMTALKNLCGRLGVEIPITQRWRYLNRELPFDCGLPIVKLMQQKGWCPHDVALFNGAQIETVSTLWYLANLSPPRTHMSHSACTAESCVPLQMDKVQYRQSHVTSGCSCSSVGSDQSTLASIIRSGKIPILAFQNDEVVMTEHVPGSSFIAISHVWADGKGNPKSNSLPSCVMRELQDLVNDLPKDSAANTPFWIDTLCVPRFPPELKMEALQRLKEPYKEAAGVLVIDSYLRCHSAAQVSPFELLARILACGWSQRLWTFQEGRLPTEPTRVWFAFKETSIDLLKEVNITYTHFPTLASHTVDLGLLFGHKQTRMIRLTGMSLTEELLQSVVSLRQSLRTRTTSQADDEGLCIGTILQLSRDRMRRIIHANGDMRMARVWDEFPEIPVGIAFSKAPCKLKVKGYRWAPKSFMGSLHLDSRQWEGPNGTWSGSLTTSILPGGLAIQRPGWALGVGSPSSQRWLRRCFDIEAVPSGKTYVLYDPAGRWFHCTLEEAWHDDTQKSSVEDFFVMILEGGPDFADTQAYLKDQNDYAWQGSQKALLASCHQDPISSREDEVVQVTVHRHIQCSMLSKKWHEVATLLKTFTDELDTLHLGPLLLGQGEDEQARLKELVSDAVRNYLSINPAALQLMKSVNVDGQWGDDDALAFDDCVGVVTLFVSMGACCVLRKVYKDRTWCVD